MSNRKTLITLALLALALASCAYDPIAYEAEPPAVAASATVAAAGATAAPQPSERLQQLVTPIALYPDVLVAQVLAATTHPDEVSHVALWLEDDRHADAAELAQAVDGESWSPDIKALVLVHPVLDALSRNYAWTVALGEVYADDPAEVLRAVQVVRHKAQAAGELASTSEQRVMAEGDTILIEPTDPAHVHVPGHSAFDIALGDRFTWGWHSWDVDWQHGALMYQDVPYLVRAD
jgi:hypothetical protein